MNWKDYRSYINWIRTMQITKRLGPMLSERILETGSVTLPSTRAVMTELR